MARQRKSREPGPPTPLAAAVTARLDKLVPAQSEAEWRAHAEELARKHARDAAEQRERNLERVQGIKDHVRAALIAGKPLRETEALHEVRGWYLSWPNATSRTSLVLAGISGIGKTVAGQWLLAHERGASWPAEFACKAYAAKFGPELERLQRDILAPVFVLEDVGTEQDEVTCCALMVWLFEQRQSASLHNLITCNMGKQLFWSRYHDPRLHSRMAEVLWRTVAGDDLRKHRGDV